MKRFEVQRDGRVMAWTEHKECIPPRERRDELRKAGYRLFLDGKIWKEVDAGDPHHAARRTAEPEPVPGQS